MGKFVEAVKTGHYDGLTFHRVVMGFVAQTGDSSTREGHPTPDVGWDLPVERNSLKHVRGALALTGATGGGGGPQFYIMYGENKQLDGTDTVFCQVLSDGPDDPLPKAIKQGDRILSMRLLPTE